jgi:hypothetical protein
VTEPVAQVEAWAVVVEGGCAPLVIEHLLEYAVTVEPPADVLVVTMGDQGPPGIAGVPGPAGGSAFQRTAGHTLSALRAVYELDDQVHYLDYRDTAHIDLLLGITLSAASAGSPVNVQRSGVIDDSGWNWTPGRIWLGIDGALTQTPPADGFDVLIGAAVSATRITLNFTDPIDLE